MQNTYKLRDYQQRVKDSIQKYLQDPKRKKPELVVVPTAGGKSILVAESVRMSQGKTLVLQPSEELLKQNLEKYESFGNIASVFCAGLNRKELDRNVIYATLDSIKAVQKDLAIDTLIIDEAHYKFSPEKGSSFSLFVDAIKPKKIIGMTATPFRLVSTMEVSELKLLTRMRPGYFRDFIDIVQIQEVVRNGFWSKLSYEIGHFDASSLQLNSTGAEFTEESIRKSVEAQKINNKIYKKIKKLLSEGIPSILVFCDTVNNAEKFKTLIPDSEVLTAKTPKKLRASIISDFKSGKIKVLFNVGILTTGFDFPDLRCVIMGRPTNSLALYYQIVGRLTRPSEKTGKEFGLFVDYGANVERFGCVEHLTLEYIEGWGYGFCSGDIVLTNQPMNAARVSKKKLIENYEKNKDYQEDKIWFGKYKGTPYSKLRLDYIKWLLYESPMTFTSGKMLDMKNKMVAILQEHNSMDILKTNTIEDVF